MKKLDSKILFIYILMSIYIVLSSFISFSKSIEVFTYIINPIVWFIIFIVCLMFYKDNPNRFKAKTDKIQTVFILILLYLIIYFVSGLFLGYKRSPYSHTLIGYFKNLIAFFAVVIFREFCRSVFINNCSKSRFIYFLTTVLFILVELNFNTFKLSLTSGAEAFKYSCSVLIPLIFKNVLLTYLVITAGYGASMAYTLPIAFASIVLPIFPALDWFMIALCELLLCLVVFINVNRIHEQKTLRLSKRILRKSSPYKKIPAIGIVILFALFVAGFFKYMPIAVMSNSMKELIERGDVVIVYKLNETEIKNLKVGDIIEYRLSNASVVHRIIKIEKDNRNILFTTKGDNNSAPDNKKVTEAQVSGIVKAKIPKIGYPSVLLNEFFQKTKPDVET